MDSRFAPIYRKSAPALFCDRHLAGRMGTTGLGSYVHYVPQLHPNPADEPLDLGQLTLIKVPVLVIKPACDYVPCSSLGVYPASFRTRSSSWCRVLFTSPTWSSQRCTPTSSSLSLPGMSSHYRPSTVSTIPESYRGTR